VLIAGFFIAAAALVAGIACTGVRLGSFFQAPGALIVFGGTLGVTVVTTPRGALRHSVSRALELTWAAPVAPEMVVEQILSFVKAARAAGSPGIEALIAHAGHPRLRDALLLSMDVRDRAELRTTLELKIRLAERQGESDAKMFETAGGFAPTIGIIGTVVGLIDVLRQFTKLDSVTYGIGTAFVSTIYGLTLANMLLLPIAQRIRARVAEDFEIGELVMEGALCVFDRTHPTLVRERLSAFLRTAA
jgi:chemotaxis protein MotA